MPDMDKAMDKAIDNHVSQMLSRAMTIIGMPIIGFFLVVLWQSGVAISSHQTEILTQLAVIQQEILEQNRRIDLLERKVNGTDDPSRRIAPR
jgi:hypothetical protein